MSESCHTHRRFGSHTWLSRAAIMKALCTHVNESWHTWTHRVSYLFGSCNAYQCVVLQQWSRHLHMWMSYSRWELVKSRVWMSHATHMKGPFYKKEDVMRTFEWVVSHALHTHMWVMSHVWVSRVTKTKALCTHVNKSWHTWASHVSYLIGTFNTHECVVLPPWRRYAHMWLPNALLHIWMSRVTCMSHT